MELHLSPAGRQLVAQVLGIALRIIEHFHSPWLPLHARCIFPRSARHCQWNLLFLQQFVALVVGDG
jgi:hypothetical protein